MEKIKKDDLENYSKPNPEIVNAESEYKKWVSDIKLRVRQSQIKAAVKVNTELLKFYWYLGNEIVEKQKHAHWGDGFLKRLSNDLMFDFPDIKGFELRNLRRIKQWFLTYNQLDAIRAHLVPELQNMFFSIPRRRVYESMLKVKSQCLKWVSQKKERKLIFLPKPK